MPEMNINETKNYDGSPARGQVRFDYVVLAWRCIVDVTGPAGTYTFAYVDFDDVKGEKTNGVCHKIVQTINAAFAE